MEKLLFFLVLLLNQTQGQAQSNISGTIKKSLSRTIDNVNVLLLRATDSVLVKGMLTDANEYLQFRDIQKGSYFIKSTYSGLNPYTSKTFSIFGQKSSLQFNASNILNTMTFRPTTNLPIQNLVSSLNFNFFQPTYKLTFTHNFGKEKLKGKRERSTGAEKEKGRVKN